MAQDLRQEENIDWMEAINNNIIMSEMPSKVGGVTFKASALDIMPLCPSIQAQMENRIYWHLCISVHK